MAKRFWLFLVTVQLVTAALLGAISPPVLSAGKLVVLKKVQLEGPVVRARLVSADLVCATQGEAGRFAFFNAASGNVLYHLSESGAARRFCPTLVSGLKGNALVLDEAHERIEFFGPDGNSTARCTLTAEVLAVPFGSPVDMLACGEGFSGGIFILTERGYILTANSEGELVTNISLRELSGRPEAFFARLGRVPDSEKYFAFSPNTSCVFLFTLEGELLQTHDLNATLAGSAQFSDVVILEDGSLIVSRGKRLTHVGSDAASDIPVASQFAEDAPLYLDMWDNRLLVYNQRGEMLVGELQ